MTTSKVRVQPTGAEDGRTSISLVMGEMAKDGRERVAGAGESKK